VLGALGETPTVAAELLFGDPVSDIAVLGCPDIVDLSPTFAERYTALVEGARPLALGRIEAGALSGNPGWRLAVDGPWSPATIEPVHGGCWLQGAPIQPGEAGSPVMALVGGTPCAVGVVNVSSQRLPRGVQRDATLEVFGALAGHARQMHLIDVLPLWLEAALRGTLTAFDRRSA